MDYITLIDRYYSGATSREEEEVLRRYLKGDNLPQEVLAERELLLSMLEPTVYDCSGAMDEVSAMIDTLAHEEALAVPPAHTARRVVLRYLLPALTVAASFALLFFLPYGGGGTVQPDASGSTSGLLVGGRGTSDTVDNASVSSANEILIVLAEEPPVIVEAVNTVQPVSTETGNRLLASNASVAAPMLEPRTGCASSLHDVQTKDVLIGVLDRPAENDANGDTFSNPDEAVDHLNVLLAFFSDAASDGMKEQEMHLQKLVMNSEPEPVNE